MQKARKLIQQANGGTLFLDEIGDMPLPLQTRLLRVLAEGHVMPLGALEPVDVDIRVLAATHCNLQKLIAEGRFREDLYYRLNGATLTLPSLKARADKQYLIQTLMKQINPTVRLRADAVSALLAYAWPGNIRQLVNALTFAEAICEGDEITVHHLPKDITMHPPEWPAFMGTNHTASDCLSETIDSHTQHYAKNSEQERLLSLLRQQRWNISAVANQLGVSRPTVYRRIKKLNIPMPKDA
ncbi:Acetoin catabolism regulatory protein [Nitrincola nitratireducens]|uniref:Acetoin catabolism regulatory protein n=1 Tax=Nitrincola nitratireducens TaxID=1229521 RepID=W9USH8_9GAMM|nr:Acetoin catabolism regulatory protein [Nitrincola nitratireducens]